MAKSQCSKYYKWGEQHKTMTRHVIDKTRNHSAKNPKKASNCLAPELAF